MSGPRGATFTALRGADLSTNTIALLVDHQQNRELLTSWLAEAFEVTTTIPDDTEDLGCLIVDEPGLERQIDEIRESVDSAAPVFLPVLFVTRNVDGLPEAVWEHVDEVVQVPIEKAVLSNRLELLLQTRERSLELQRQRKRSERRFEHLFKTAPDPVLIVEDDGTIVEVNETFLNLTGESRDSLVGKNVLDVGFEPAETLERILLRVEDGDRPADRTVEYRGADGRNHISELNADVISHLSDSTERIAMFRDVTERKEYSQGLERKVDRLEDFSGIVTHDLRNPLTIAKGNVDVAREATDSEELARAREALDRMEDLIQTLLDFARSGTLVTEPEAIDLDTVARKSFDIVESDDDVTLEVDTTASVFGDPEQLQRVFENLYRNALEHGNRPVTIRVGELADGFFVEDDGPGIPPEDREDIFSLGYTTDEGGSGLGLSIVRDIVDAHQWTVSVEEGSDGGARFEFRNVAFST